MNCILAVVGPTASGKTSLAIELADRLHTEIISADSMQVYKGMEIGTGAPSAEELARVKHHFVSMLDPGTPFSAGEFERGARAIVERLNADGKPAVVVGGSGLYVRALLDGLFDGPAGDDTVRARLNAEAAATSVDAMYRRLQEIDPAYAAQIAPVDLKRIVRALEVYEITGQTFSALHAEHQAAQKPLSSVQVLIDWPRAQLYDRINARVDKMLADGFIDEVKRLVDAGYEKHLRRLRSLGYPEFLAHLRGELSLDEATGRMKQYTRNFAKRQLTWFRADRRIHWLPVECDNNPRDLPSKVLELRNELR